MEEGWRREEYDEEEEKGRGPNQYTRRTGRKAAVEELVEHHDDAPPLINQRSSFGAITARTCSGEQTKDKGGRRRRIESRRKQEK